MTVPSVSWAENSPAGSDNISLGDNRIREMKTQLREVIGVDHDFPSSGQADDNGQHLRVTLQEQEDIGTGAVGTTILGSQTIDGKGELVYTTEDDADIQLTKDGEIYPGVAPTLANWTEVLKLFYPVGSIYMNASVSTNPATLLGFGTWATIGAGRVPVAIDVTQTEFDTLGETGGAKTVTLTAAQSGVAAHSHLVFKDAQTNAALSSSNYPASTYSVSDDIATQVKGQTGVPDAGKTKDATAANAAEAHTNLQPYVVCAIWKRTV